MPFIILIVGVVLSFLTYYISAKEQYKALLRTFESIAITEHSILEREIESIQSNLKQLCQFFELSDNISKEDFNKKTALYLSESNADLIAFLPKDSDFDNITKTQLVSLKENLPNDFLSRLFQEKPAATAYQEALKKNEMSISPLFPFKLHEKTKTENDRTLTPYTEINDELHHLIFFFPCIKNGELMGHIIAVFHFDSLVQNMFEHIPLKHQTSIFFFTKQKNIKKLINFSGHPPPCIKQSHFPTEYKEIIKSVDFFYKTDLPALPSMEVLFAPGKHCNKDDATFFPVILFSSNLFITFLLVLLSIQQVRRQNLVESKVVQKTQDILEANKFLNLIMETVPDMLFVKDRNYNIIQTNKAFLDFFPPEEHNLIIGNSPIEENGKGPFTQRDTEVLGDGEAEFIEDLTDYKGKTKTLLTKKVGFKDQDGKPFLLGYSRDITDIKMAQKKLQAILDNTADGLVISSQDGTIELFNKAAEEMFGYKANELIGKNVKVLMPESYRQHHHEYIETYLSTRRPKLIGNGVEVQALKKDGTTFPAHISLSKAEVASQLYFCAFFRDLTEDKLEQETNRQRQKMEDLGYLAGGVAHEINNLLQPVILLSEGLKKELQDNEADLHEDIDSIISHTDSAAQIISDILDFSRKDKTDSSLHDLEKELENAIDFSTTLLPKSLNITKAGFGTEANPLYSMINANDLKRVLSNILVNASHATDKKGTITISFKTAYIDKKQAILAGLKTEGQYGLLSVEDDGIGIKEGDLPHIFTPFFTTKDIGEGTGMGLSIIYNIVTEWNGSITVKSRHGEGATFTVYLPIIDNDIL